MLLKVHNWNDLPPEAIDAYGKGAKTLELGALAGSRQLYANVDIIPPGAYSAKYHAHSLQEEFFVVLAGNGVLRTPLGEQPVREGDFVAKPAGHENPHTFYNPGPGELRILDVGTVPQGDVAYYPDEDVYLLRGRGIVLPGGTALQGWSSDPNE